MEIQDVFVQILSSRYSQMRGPNYSITYRRSPSLVYVSDALRENVQ